MLPDTQDEDDASNEGLAIVDVLSDAGIDNGESQTEKSLKRQAADTYQLYATQYRRRFKWIKTEHFNPTLKKDLQQDSRKLLTILAQCGTWDTEQDAKFTAW
ncbi:hypothetical protein KDW_36850 [Dictyobacter vulcani]|uniref:Uncharacterized protein n=1 Tax=Dictyobacter vulcani TaxID=2607529 RepID=A0A5J4KPI4_9CHLR|nr:hypothetical protein [Dictyobacter vulcani]GER89523.1 hypothetical protein KDW_36850 [Dictyobacter vulcani]